MELELFILVFYQIWQQSDEPFHVDRLDTDLLVEAVFAKEWDVLYQVCQKIRGLHITLYKISYNRYEKCGETWAPGDV